MLGSELRVPPPDVVAMHTRQSNLEGAGEIPPRRLVKEALRMQLFRIVVAEVRQQECLDLATRCQPPDDRWGGQAVHSVNRPCSRLQGTRVPQGVSTPQLSHVVVLRVP